MSLKRYALSVCLMLVLCLFLFTPGTNGSVQWYEVDERSSSPEVPVQDDSKQLITPEFEAQLRMQGIPGIPIMVGRDERNGRPFMFHTNATTVLSGQARTEALGGLIKNSTAANATAAVASVVSSSVFNVGLGSLLIKNKVQMVHALAGSQANVALSQPTARLELRFSDLVGCDPDEFNPVVIKLTPTKNNYRLAYVKNEKGGRLSFDFVEDRVNVRTERIARGHYAIFIDRDLEPGEYAVVVRPINANQKPKKDAASLVAEFQLTSSIWDFTKK